MWFGVLSSSSASFASFLYVRRELKTYYCFSCSSSALQESGNDCIVNGQQGQQNVQLSRDCEFELFSSNERENLSIEMVRRELKIEFVIDVV